MSDSPSTWTRDQAALLYEERRRHHWDGVARNSGRIRSLAVAYHRRLARIYAFLIPPGRSVLEVGCGRGDLLACLRPAHGVGVDLSGEMVASARKEHPECKFI